MGVCNGNAYKPHIFDRSNLEIVIKFSFAGLNVRHCLASSSEGASSFDGASLSNGASSMCVIIRV